MGFSPTFGRAFSPTFKPNSLAEASVAWTPTSVSGCQMWLDFSDATKLFTDAGTTPVSSDGDAIYQANDKSGNNRHALQSSSALRPLYKTNIQNSLSTGYFDGSNDVMTLVDIALSNYSVFIAFRFVTQPLYTAALYAFDNYSTSPRYANNLYAYRGNAPAGFHYEAYANNTGALATSAELTNNTPYLVDTIRTTTAVAYNKNGSGLTGVTVGSGAFTTVGHRLGTHYYSGANQNQYFKGYACELIIYDSALSSGDQALARSYLNTKWSIY
jgi:hypothetical protein